MVLILGLAGLIWWGGNVIGLQKPLRQMLLALLFGAVVLAHLTLPETNALRLATGGSATPWLMLGGVAGLVAIYATVLRRLRSRAEDGEAQQDAADAADAPAFSDVELNRYARHIVLREVGGLGQKRLKDAKVLVIGAGGLGAPVLQYLAGAGVGTIGVIDDDVVDNSNLQRQVIHRDDDIGTPKVFSAQAAMEAQNPYVHVRPYHRRLTEEIAPELFADFDLIVDGSDNFDTRYLSNRVAVSLGKPLVSGAISQWEGQVSLFDPTQAGPCYQCIFPEAPAAELAPSCAEAGVIGPLPGVLGAIMAVEVVKYITAAGAPLRGKMLIYDGLYGETRKIRLSPRKDCPICSGLDGHA